MRAQLFLGRPVAGTKHLELSFCPLASRVCPAYVIAEATAREETTDSDFRDMLRGADLGGLEYAQIYSAITHRSDERARGWEARYEARGVFAIISEAGLGRRVRVSIANSSIAARERERCPTSTCFQLCEWCSR